MACKWSVMDFPIWLVNLLLTAISPLGRVSLVLAIGGAVLAAQTNIGGYHMIMGIPEIQIALALFGGALAFLLAAYFCEYEDRNKNRDEEQYKKFHPGFYLAILLGAGLATALGLGIIIGLGFFTEVVITNVWACGILCFFLGMICAVIIDTYFVSKVANGTWDAWLVRVRNKTEETVETVVSELDPVAVAQILSLAGRSDMTAQVLQEMQARQKKE